MGPVPERLCARPLPAEVFTISRESPPALRNDSEHRFGVERVTGIEPALSAWEAEVLPLNYTRATGLKPGRDHSLARLRPGATQRR
jgi:hypothetical protein